MEVVGLLPFLNLRNYLKILSTPVKLSSCLPLPFLADIGHISSLFPQDPHLSTASHFDLSFMVSLEGIYLPRHALLALLWGQGELLLLFIHHLIAASIASPYRQTEVRSLQIPALGLVDHIYHMSH